MDRQKLADAIFGTRRLEADDNESTATTFGRATSDSQDGRVYVVVNGSASVKSDSDAPLPERDVLMPTSESVKSGDDVIITLVGGRAKVPTVTAVVGSGDRQDAQTADAKAAADAADAEAKEAQRQAQAAQAKADSNANELAQAQKDSDAAIKAVQQDVADFKATADATYATTESVDEKTGAITKTMQADYLSKTDANATYTEKTTYEEGINSLKNTMEGNYSSFTDYRDSNDKALATTNGNVTSVNNALAAYQASNDAKVNGLQNIADAAIETWYLNGEPTTANDPARNWTSDSLKSQHAGDLYYDVDTGYSYRWTGTGWVRIKDSDITAALGEIDTIKTDYATKSELSKTDTELRASVSDTLDQAKTYSSGLVTQERTDRDAAIQAKADEVSLSASKTYATQSDFSGYKSSNDSAVADAKKAGTDAQSSLDSYKSTVATTYATKSELKVTNDSITSQVQAGISNLKIGGRNLLKDSAVQHNNPSNYPPAQWDMSVRLEAGKEYTATAWVSQNYAAERLMFFIGGGSLNAGSVLTGAKLLLSENSDVSSSEKTGQGSSHSDAPSYWRVGGGGVAGPARLFFAIDVRLAGGVNNGQYGSFAPWLYCPDSAGNDYWEPNVDGKFGVNSVGTGWTHFCGFIDVPSGRKATYMGVGLYGDHVSALDFSKPSLYRDNGQGQYSVTFTATDAMAQAKNSLILFARDYRDSYDEEKRHYVVVDRAKLELGNKPTDWTPAPEDTDSEIASANSKITQLSDRITSEVTAREKTDGNVSDLTSKVTQTNSRVDTVFANASNAQSTADAAKTAAANAQSTADGTKSDLSSYKGTVSSTYATKTSTTQTYVLYAQGGKACWSKLGTLTSAGDNSSVLIDVMTGNGYNGSPAQNSSFSIFIKDGWQSTASTNLAFGVTVDLGSQNYNSGVKVKVLASASNVCDVWAYLPWAYSEGNYSIRGRYSKWVEGKTSQTNEPTSGTAQQVSYSKIANKSEVDAVDAKASNLATLIRQSSAGVEVGKTDANGAWQTNRALVSSAGDFQVLAKDGTQLARFASDVVELGRNSRNAVINMCGSAVKIAASKPDDNTNRVGIQAVNQADFKNSVVAITTSTGAATVAVKEVSQSGSAVSVVGDSLVVDASYRVLFDTPSVEKGGSQMYGADVLFTGDASYTRNHAVTLSRSVSNYSMIEIFYEKWQGDERTYVGSERFYGLKPGGEFSLYANEVSVWGASSNTQGLVVHCRTFTVSSSGTVLDTKFWNNQVYLTGRIFRGADGTAFTQVGGGFDYLGITCVLGWK